MEYNVQASKRIRVGFIGAGMHSYRNIYPSFQYAPVELVAVADIREERAVKYARLFGGERHYGSHTEMLEKERDLDAVFIVTDIDDEGNPRYPPLAIDAMRAGCHVWIEKPPASRTSQIEKMQRVSEETNKFVAVGYKKMFYPSYEKMKEIIDSPEFGQPTTIYLRYQLSMADPSLRDSDKHWKWPMSICHPASALQYLLGPINDLFYRREPTGDVGAVVTFSCGTIGVLHFTGRQSASSPMERIEVFGEGANVLVDNGVRLTYYRNGGERGGDTYYHKGGPTADNYIGADATAPIYWEPMFSRGSLHNKAIFLLGYVGEVSYFADCVLNNQHPTRANLEDAWHVTRLFEAFRYGDPGTVIRLADINVPVPSALR